MLAHKITNNSEISDLDGISKCHMLAFGSSLSTKLGDKFVKKMLEWYVVSDRGIMSHISIDN